MASLPIFGDSFPCRARGLGLSPAVAQSLTGLRSGIVTGPRRLIADEGFDPVYGARPLRRFMARDVETRIGRALLAGDVEDGAVIQGTRPVTWRAR